MSRRLFVWVSVVNGDFPKWMTEYSFFFKRFLCFYPLVCGFGFVSFFFTNDLKSIHIAINSVFKTWVSISLITMKSCI